MMTTTYLDLREIAGEWRAELEGIAEGWEESEIDRDLITACESLCGELGCDPTPDDLQAWGNNYDPTMIREDAFEDYARELAEDIGAIPSDAGWPACCIDWEQAARELAMDYTSVRFMGDDYYIRA